MANLILSLFCLSLLKYFCINASTRIGALEASPHHITINDGVGTPTSSDKSEADKTSNLAQSMIHVGLPAGAQALHQNMEQIPHPFPQLPQSSKQTLIPHPISPMVKHTLSSSSIPHPPIMIQHPAPQLINPIYQPVGTPLFYPAPPLPPMFHTYFPLQTMQQPNYPNYPNLDVFRGQGHPGGFPSMMQSGPSPPVVVYDPQVVRTLHQIKEFFTGSFFDHVKFFTSTIIQVIAKMIELYIENEMSQETEPTEKHKPEEFDQNHKPEQYDENHHKMRNIPPRELNKLEEEILNDLEDLENSNRPKRDNSRRSLDDTKIETEETVDPQKKVLKHVHEIKSRELEKQEVHPNEEKTKHDEAENKEEHAPKHEAELTDNHEAKDKAEHETTDKAEQEDEHEDHEEGHEEHEEDHEDEPQDDEDNHEEEPTQNSVPTASPTPNPKHGSERNPNFTSNKATIKADKKNFVIPINNNEKIEFLITKHVVVKTIVKTQGANIIKEVYKNNVFNNKLQNDKKVPIDLNAPPTAPPSAPVNCNTMHGHFEDTIDFIDKFQRVYNDPNLTTVLSDISEEKNQIHTKIIDHNDFNVYEEIYSLGENGKLELQKINGQIICTSTH